MQERDSRVQFDTILKEAKERCRSTFSLMPKADVIVEGSSIGSFYSPPALDGSRPGFFATAYPMARYTMRSLTYHEAVPGHHFQIALTREIDLPMVRQGMDFTSYVEGWDYAEWLAGDLGWYEGDWPVTSAVCRWKRSGPLAW